MEAVEALTLFIERVVIKEKRERYAGFVATEKNRKKFLDALDHALASEIRTGSTVATLSEEEWSERGFLYSSDGVFGADLGSLKDGYENGSPYGGWLILSQSASVAIFRPEGRIDDELYFRL